MRLGKAGRGLLQERYEALIVYLGGGIERILKRFHEAVGVSGLPQGSRHHFDAFRYLGMIDHEVLGELDARHV